MVEVFGSRIKRILVSLAFAVVVMLPFLTGNAIAATDQYSCGTYGSGSYAVNCAVEEPADDANQSGWLGDTGTQIAIFRIVGVVCLMISVALIIATLRKRKREDNSAESKDSRN